ncbi:MAG: hypothetical protein QM805_07670 [Pseudomonas sp.]
MPSVVPDMPELFEEAFERAGLEMRSGYDLKTIRRSLNIMSLEWANRGLNLWTIEAGSQPLTPGVATYTMPADTIDLIEHQLRIGTGVSQIDTDLQRVSVSTYAQQAVKNLSGRPTQIYIQRLATSTEATLWPVPDSITPYTLVFYRLKGMDGLSSGIGSAVTSVPPRFVPALVAGLAYHIAAKKAPGAAMMLKQEYEAQFALAASEDRDRASVFFVPYSGDF